MLKVSRLANIRFGGIFAQTQRFYTVKENASEPPIEPVQMSYNSYENSNSNTSPVIIMHGLFGSKQNWRGIGKAIHAKTNPTRKVYAVDARNHGESPHSPHHRYVDLAEDLHLFYKEHKIEKAVVIGHSMGGRAMMAFALKYPHLVEKAIIVDVSPVTTSPALKNMADIFSAMRRVSLPSDISLPEARILADEQMKKTIPNKVTRSFILMNLHRAVNGVIQWRSNIDSLDDNFVKHIARFLGPQQIHPNNYKAPILFIGGLRSDYLTYHWSVNVSALDNHQTHLVSFVEELKQFRFDGPILFLGGDRSHLVKHSQIDEMRILYPKAQIKILIGGHNIGLIDSREEFLDEVTQFIDNFE